MLQQTPARALSAVRARSSLVGKCGAVAPFASRHQSASRRPCATLSSNMSKEPHVLIFDVMDTIVFDPFYDHMPKYFNISFKELLASKHPTAWVEFEKGLINEEQLLGKFFADGRSFDGPGLIAHMVSAYRYIDGIPELLQRLKACGVEMHIMSNYPMWYRYIEEKLLLSQYLPWTFISCEGPMKGLRKPDAAAFEVVVNTLQKPSQQLIFVDDRKVNVEAAAASGLKAVHFTGSVEDLEQQLLDFGVEGLQ